jgi:hypothetical protein
MRTTNLVAFTKTNCGKLLTEFGFQIEQRDKKRLVFEPDNKPAKCEGCHKELTVDKVGTVAPGSHLLFCDDPICFAGWIAEHKVEA